MTNRKDKESPQSSSGKVSRRQFLTHTGTTLSGALSREKIGQTIFAEICPPLDCNLYAPRELTAGAKEKDRG